MTLPEAFVAPKDAHDVPRSPEQAGIRVARVCESAWAIVQSRPDRSALLASRPDHPPGWRALVEKFKQ